MVDVAMVGERDLLPSQEYVERGEEEAENPFMIVQQKQQQQPLTLSCLRGVLDIEMISPYV